MKRGGEGTAQQFLINLIFIPEEERWRNLRAGDDEEKGNENPSFRLPVIDSSSSVEARPAPDRIAHPQYVPALERPPNDLHHRRSRLPQRCGTHPPALALLSSSISISNSSAGSGSGTVKRLGPSRHLDGCRCPSEDTRLISPCTPWCPSANARHVLPSASTGREAAGQRGPWLVPDVNHRDLGGRCQSPAAATPPPTRDGLPSHLLWCRRREQRRAGRRTDQWIMDTEGRGGLEKYNGEREETDTRLTGSR
ncbi:hypothetical protein C2845_PM08G16660 [Panicum miliaceum]|uniref:Uncharacterized protein n=1 Tax=Panicum miliaceum TaxID=4540 RepID=A0A3L6QXV4_PANMI|nr:hypothetical protein C2845_PM08G16660 [Panicum miliaceum]